VGLLFKAIKEDRFPVPIIYETYAGHTKERFLKSRVNPSGSQVESSDVDYFFYLPVISQDFILRMMPA